MPDPTEPSRRERQIMDTIYARGESTVNQVIADLDDPPTAMAIRRTLHILEEKGFLHRRQDGREVTYLPVVAKESAGRRALGHVINTFFGGALDEALAAHLADGEKLSPEKAERMKEIIECARKEGR